jgi:hypothetical protein
MPSRGFHLLATWLCLFWLGLGNTVLASGIVICRDGHGDVSLEWGCDRNPQGECQTACEGEDVPCDPVDPAHPCQDTPIPSGLHIAKAPPRTGGEPMISFPVLVAVLFVWAEPPRTLITTWDRSPSERPPDVLKHIRSVVLLV